MPSVRSGAYITQWIDIMPKIITQFALGLWGIAPGNYSAIAPIEPGQYAIVDDKDAVDGFKYLTLEVDSISGRITYAELREPSGMAQRRADGIVGMRDCEGACYFTPSGTVFVSGEARQDILEYNDEGNPTGRRLAVPDGMGPLRIAANLGFEALTYNAAKHRFWTTTESMLPADGSPLLPIDPSLYEEPLHPLSIEPAEADASQTSAGAETETAMLQDGPQIEINVDQTFTEAADSLLELSTSGEEMDEETDGAANPRFQNCIRLLSFGDDLKPAESYIYELDEPISAGRRGNGVHGVASMFALDNGKLLVLEREGFCPRWKYGAFVNHKLYVVDPSQEQAIPLDTPMQRVAADWKVRKQLLVEFQTKLTLFSRTLANYEGVCLGPRLADGRQTLLLIADSQKGMGNFLFHLKDYVGVIVLSADNHLLE